MRRYENEEGALGSIKKIICNNCGKHLKIEKGMLKEECFYARHSFGYFSNKDGKDYEIDLCEECFDRITENFIYPPSVMDRTEIL